jgi:hypothetical protein
MPSTWTKGFLKLEIKNQIYKVILFFLQLHKSSKKKIVSINVEYLLFNVNSKINSLSLLQFYFQYIEYVQFL